jgi:carbonic anhydrase
MISFNPHPPLPAGATRARVRLGCQVVVSILTRRCRRVRRVRNDLADIRDYKARMREAVVANVFYQKNILMQNAVVKESIAQKQVKVVGAYYEIGSGAVDFLGEE